MTGHALIFRLNQLSFEDLGLPVYAEGCDCTGPATGITIINAYDDQGQPTRAVEVSRICNHQ